MHNLHRVLNILHEKSNICDNALLSLDAEKAFDRIEWQFLFKTMERMGFGEKFMKWVRILYANPSAEILTNGTISTPFRLYRGTRQGCPLSPLLFTLAIEPLAMAIRNHACISGITIGSSEHHIPLYADDIIIFSSNLKRSIPALLNLIEMFGKFSGYKINNYKSVLLFLHKAERLSPPVQSPFTISQEGFTYLGIKITPTVNEIVAANYKPISDSITGLLNRWTKLPISLIGRVNILKISILPKLLYLFQSIPLPPQSSFFVLMKKTFTNFIWNNKRPLLRLSLLYLPYDRGGLNLPNLKWYYWAAQIRAAMFYFEKDYPPTWVSMEAHSIPIPLNLYLYSADAKKLIKGTKNPYTRNTLTVWFEALAHLGELPQLSRSSPVLVMKISVQVEPIQVLKSGQFKVLVRCLISIMKDTLCPLKKLGQGLEFRKNTFSNICNYVASFYQDKAKV